jgi:hypothetical protein
MTHIKTIQEDFIINILNGKKEGYYVEQGAFHSSNGSNTYLLEKDYGWNGVSFEINKDFREEFIKNRSNPCMGDALDFNYISYFEENNFPKQIDYLQVDIDAGYQKDGRPYGSAYTSLHGLITIPLSTYRFTIITFEHDANMYWKNISIRDIQREILDSFGYSLVVRSESEDWWVDPQVIELDNYRKYLEWKHL